MREALVELLADPQDGGRLVVVDAEYDGTGEILSGWLKGARGHRYEIQNRIPRFVETTDTGQRQTERSFAFKWEQEHTYTSAAMLDQSRAWLVSRYGFASAEAMASFMSARPRVLDAGCGGGFSASLWMPHGWRGPLWVGADISRAVDVAMRTLAGIPNTHFVQADILSLPFGPETFDVIFSEGVLHHTPSTKAAFLALVPLLRRGGELMAYIYRRKAPVREFTDDHVRHALSGLPPEEAWQQLRALTALGKALAELDAHVDLAEPIPYLGIAAGRHDVQRLIYWSFAKMFWNPHMTFEENNHVNFDWYHPTYAHRHTEEELRAWCDEASLRITHFDIQESGFTVRAVRT